MADFERYEYLPTGSITFSSTARSFGPKLITITVAGDSDDGAIDGDLTWRQSGEAGNLGWFGEYSDNKEYFSYFRFALPSALLDGYNVLDSRINIYGHNIWNWNGDTDALIIYGEDVSDATVVGGGDTHPTEGGNQRSLTSASVVWSESGSGDTGLVWNVSGLNTSTNIKTIIQELIDDNTGLSSGANIQLWLTINAVREESVEVGYQDYAKVGDSLAAFLQVYYYDENVYFGNGSLTLSSEAACEQSDFYYLATTDPGTLTFGGSATTKYREAIGDGTLTLSGTSTVAIDYSNVTGDGSLTFSGVSATAIGEYIYATTYGTLTFSGTAPHYFYEFLGDGTLTYSGTAVTYGPILMTIAVAGDSDDGSIDGSLSWWKSGEVGNLGWFGEYPADSEQFGYFRFLLSSGLLATTTILDSRINIYGHDTWNWDIDTDALKIYIEDVTDADAVGSGDTHPTAGGSARTLSSSSVIWSEDGTGDTGLDWNTSGWNTSTDVKSLIQNLSNSNDGLSNGVGIQFWITKNSLDSESEEVGYQDYAKVGDSLAAYVQIYYTNEPYDYVYSGIGSIATSGTSATEESHDFVHTPVDGVITLSSNVATEESHDFVHTPVDGVITLSSIAAYEESHDFVNIPIDGVITFSGTSAYEEFNDFVNIPIDGVITFGALATYEESHDFVHTPVDGVITLSSIAAYEESHDFVNIPIDGVITFSGTSVNSIFTTSGTVTFSGTSAFEAYVTYSNVIGSGAFTLSGNVPALTTFYTPATIRVPTQYIETNYIEIFKKSSPVKGSRSNIEWEGDLIDSLLSAGTKTKGKRTHISKVRDPT